ncbi:unnamed protein product [Ceutorhynchus assimilis]|uniref:Poly [ADP-ribose] polymerase n=1 Tax=Ceutorhynchus assimilis TaxID=467358 RepID=A0A9N9MPI6_9CUCU|nr:unnamed protein product [Ceutorhynchus assimilis]
MPKGKIKSTQISVEPGKMKQNEKTKSQVKNKNGQKTGAMKNSVSTKNWGKPQNTDKDQQFDMESYCATKAIGEMQKSFKAMDINENKNTIITKKGNILQVIPKDDKTKCFCNAYNRKPKKTCCSSLPKKYPTITSPPENNPENRQNAWLKKKEISLEQIMIEEKIKRRQEKLKQESYPVQQQPMLIAKPIEIVANPSLIQEFTYSFGLLPSYTKDLYILEDINSRSSSYETISNSFKKSMTSYKIASIKKVINPYLLLHYKLRKQAMGICKELLLYHGTKIENIDSICADNFDWRLVSRHKYGWGVSFSSSPYYASHYSDETGTMKAMFVVQVLVGQEWRGNCETEVPKSPFDTTTDPNEKVYVKYDDCCFYPAYVIYYTSK